MNFAQLCGRLQRSFVLLPLSLFSISGCIYRFANSDRIISSQPRTLYISNVTDGTARAGQAPKLTAALRRLITQNREFILTDVHTARWGLEIQITDAARSVTRVEKCDQGNEILASGAVPCSKIKSENKLPDVSAEDEVAQMSVVARALDLRTGAVLFQLNLPNIATGAYPIVGDGTVRASLSNSQDLHVLRYMENSENAVESLAGTIAARIYDQLVAIPPPSPSL
ncbi:MAG: hypothetical protein EBR09_09415 [Proteobacteria bacterium]|nr:hypothetical protein [Pseudomonadota bacterium]